MAPRTPRRLHAAEPFVSFSLSKVCASRIAQIIEANKAPADEKVLTPLIKNKKRSAKRTFRHSDAAETIKSPKPSKRRKISHNETSTPNTLDSSTLGVEYDSPNTPSTHGRTKMTKSGDTSLPKLQIQTQGSLNEHLQQLSDGPQRRSSTVSLTDSVTRMSNRARKLTAKAQALAGTNFLPSLQNMSDVETDLIQNMREISLDHVGKDDEIQSQNITGVNTPRIVADDAPVESVETPTIRISTRERKPTARAIELESIKASRKRPASPVVSDQASKVAKQSPASDKPSKLRDEFGDRDTGLPNLPYDANMEVPRSQDESMDVLQVDMNEGLDDHLRIPDSQEVAPRQTSDRLDDVGEKIKLASSDGSNDLSHEAEMVKVVGYEKPLIEESSEPPADQDEEDGLLSLSPSSRLVAFAKIAAEWSDSDEESDEDDIDLSVAGETAASNTTMTEKACQIYLLQKSSASGVSDLTAKSTSQSVATSPVAKVKTVARNTSSKRNQVNHKVGGTTRRSTRVKPHPLSQQSNFQEPKIHTTNKTKPVIEHGSSSFERRMQNDYLEAQEKKSSVFAQTIEDTNHDPLQQDHSILYLQDPDFQFIYNQPPIPPLKHGLVNGSNSKDSKIPNLDHSGSTPNLKLTDDIATKEAPDLLQSEHTVAKPPFLQKATLGSSEMGKFDNKARKTIQKPGKIKVKGGGKSSDGVFVQQSLNEKSAHERGHGTKEYPVLAPPQAKSIKLRFTTMAK